MTRRKCNGSRNRATLGYVMVTEIHDSSTYQLSFIGGKIESKGFLITKASDSRNLRTFIKLLWAISSYYSPHMQSLCLNFQSTYTFPPLSTMERNNLHSDFANQEIKPALFSIGPYKALSWDGFSAHFFNVVGHFVVQF